jgi:two-component system response regulator HydG
MGSSSTDSAETKPEADPHQSRAAERVPAPGLVVLFSSEGAEHVGAWLPIPEGKPRLLGRGAAQAEDEAIRLVPLQQRPRRNVELTPFANPALSREQLLVGRDGAQTLSIENLGRCRLLVNGEEAEQQVLQPGDVLEVGGQLVLLCSVRAPRLEGPPGEPTYGFGHADPHGFVGESPAAWRLRAEIAAVAPRSGHVLVFGDTGSGKELVANALHALAHRSGKLVARNAATLPESLVDAEIFGNLKDYPNPGMPDRRGLLGAADAGSLFLDEFAELPLPAQAHLLRALDRGEYQRLGETTTRKSSFRLLAATNRPESALRRDLLERFDFRLRVPALAARREDIPFIARHLFTVMAGDAPDLCARFSGDGGMPKLSPNFVARLARHPFLGNVRELRSLLWSSLHAATGDVLEWPSSEQQANVETDPGDTAEAADMTAIKLKRVLDENGGSMEKSFRALGLSSRYALLRLLKKHGITVKRQTSHSS